MSYDDAGTEPVRRFEVFTGAGRRRSWTDEGKAEILAESYSGSESISAVARRHGLSPSQLFTWRRELRKAAAAAAASPSFVPAIIEAAPPPLRDQPPAPKRRRARRARTTGTVVELEIDGVAVKIAQGADAKVIAAVIDALKTGR